ncbi:fibropellin-1-like [Ruditapes philippinarum]|uniref:fibropellin-1-like n=1 Tax=Ruditapes philippinarum TaxID=129788 RepID=UPI00295B2F36|nr:fibropellin-1-like [Ruditapes philippinarum]
MKTYTNGPGAVDIVYETSIMLFYGTLIGEPCTSSLSTCTDNNAGCNGTVCDCLSGFAHNGSICVGADLCDPCDTTCQSPYVCSSSTYRCECPPDEVQISDSCYGTHVGDACTTSLNTCIDDYAECNGTICNCIAGYNWNGSRCNGNSLCDPCDPSSSTCSPDLECSATTYRCECPSGQVQIGDECYGTLVTEPCTLVVDTCIDDNAICNGTVCDCEDGYSWNGTQCNGQNLCDPCDPSNPTCSSELTCSSDTYRCECLTNQVQVGDNCYGTRVGEPCTTTPDTCIDDNAGCNGTVCDCLQGYKFNGTFCVGQHLCDLCDSATLLCDSNLVCSSETYKCECPTDEVQIGDDCYGTRVGEACTTVTDTCTDDNAECNGTVCTCVTGFIWNGSLCVGPGLCDPCDPATPSCGSGLVCSGTTYRCECPSDEVQITDGCYGTDIGDDCLTTLTTCVDDNAECSSGTCSCSSPFTFNATLGICVGPNLDDPCDSDSCGTGLTCGTTSQRCECETPRVQIDNVCYGTRVTESCTVNHDTCIDDNAECLAGVCTCLTGYSWNGLICVGSEIDDPCDSSSCGDGLVCGPTNRCECESPRVQVNNLCYALICDNCTTNSDCLGTNQICLNYTCQCDTNYYLDNCSICQPKVSNGQSCLADEECLSGICACNECVASVDDDCCEDCEDIRSDITIVTDASGSPGTFAEILGFASALVNAFVVSPTDVQIGVVDFAGSVDNGDSFNMNVETNNLDVTFEIVVNNYNGGSRRTDLGLDRARSYYGTSANRAGVNNFVILLTDGSASDSGALTTSANLLNAVSDMKVFAVGINNLAPLSELQTVATDNTCAFQTATTTTLNTIVQEILDNSCLDV